MVQLSLGCWEAQCWTGRLERQKQVRKEMSTWTAGVRQVVSQTPMSLRKNSGRLCHSPFREQGLLREQVSKSWMNHPLVGLDPRVLVT
jgi:hypothetical protein